MGARVNTLALQLGQRRIVHEPNGMLKDKIQPERRLLIGILMMALKDFVEPEDGLRQEDARSARYYFESLRSDEYGSLGHVCRELNLCPKKIVAIANQASTYGRMKACVNDRDWETK